MHIIDISNQRTENRKWIHYFENDRLCFILFTVDLELFNISIFEDNSITVLEESFYRWERMCNLKCFRKALKTLIFTNIDRFQSKVENGETLEKFELFIENRNQSNVRDSDSKIQNNWKANLEYIKNEFVNVHYTEHQMPAYVIEINQGDNCMKQHFEHWIRWAKWG